MKLLSSVFGLLLCCLASAAPPAPPVFRGAVAPTNGFWVTNISFVFTNVAVVKPGGTFPQVTLYSTDTLMAGNPLSWNFSSDPTASGYKLYYGQVSATVTNAVPVRSNINAITFYSTLSNGVPYWAYVTCLGTNGQESVPSVVITFTPH